MYFLLALLVAVLALLSLTFLPLEIRIRQQPSLLESELRILGRAIVARTDSVSLDRLGKAQPQAAQPTMAPETHQRGVVSALPAFSLSLSRLGRLLHWFGRISEAMAEAGVLERPLLRVEGGVGDPFWAALLRGGLAMLAGMCLGARGNMPELRATSPLTAKGRLLVELEAHWRGTAFGVLRALGGRLRPDERWPWPQPRRG